MLSKDRFEEAQDYLELLGRCDTEDVRKAFVFLHLGFSRLGDLQAEVGRHGVMKSLRFYDQGAWCFAFAPARQWVKAWVRPPEYRKGLLQLSDLTMLLPHASDRGDDHFVVRLYGQDEAKAFYDVITASRLKQ